MKKLRLLIDFGSIKTGGGAQLATNFLSFMKNYPDDVEKLYLLIPERGPLSQHIDKSRYDGVLVYPNSYWKRKIFELTTLRSFVKNNKINVFYTFFGSGLPAPKKVYSVVSVAYPIICYPDSSFWKLLDFKLKPRLEILIRLRRHRIRMADKIIAETEVMANRLVKYVHITRDKIAISPPSPSTFLEDRSFRNGPRPDKFKLLLLSGLDPHKNIWRLPEIANELANSGLKNFVFLVSVKRDQFEKTLKKRISGEMLNSHFEFLGSVPPNEIQKLYDKADLMINISDLESFSNNYMEAWKAGLPLICGETDFAKHICANSAIYINPHKPKDSAEKIIKLLESDEKQAELVKNGKFLLSQLPTIEEKFLHTMNIIRETMLKEK